MIKLKISLQRPGIADGTYALKAKGCLVVSLHWADERGPLDGWTAFAYVPLDAGGNGVFQYTGERAIPAEATHVYGKGITADFEQTDSCLAKIPHTGEVILQEYTDDVHFLVMSDMHLSTNAGTVRHALRLAKEYAFLLITGDLVNDGMPEQFRLFCQCIQEEAPELPIFTVAGNHDFPHDPLPLAEKGVCDYASFQDWLRKRSLALGVQWEQDLSGAYVVRLGETEVIGLSEMTHWRKFTSQGGAQLQWLNRYLAQSEAGRHVIMCHAPLRAHNSQRTGPCDAPYLRMDKMLQAILDRCGNVVFLTGHTHLSPNIPRGCVEYDRKHNNIYIDNGSIHPTDMKGEKLVPARWAGGVMTEILMGSKTTEITMKQMWGEKKISRGYYRFMMEH